MQLNTISLHIPCYMQPFIFQKIACALRSTRSIKITICNFSYMQKIEKQNIHSAKNSNCILPYIIMQSIGRHLGSGHLAMAYINFWRSQYFRKKKKMYPNSKVKVNTLQKKTHKQTVKKVHKEISRFFSRYRINILHIIKTGQQKLQKKNRLQRST